MHCRKWTYLINETLFMYDGYKTISISGEKELEVMCTKYEYMSGKEFILECEQLHKEFC